MVENMFIINKDLRLSLTVKLFLFSDLYSLLFLFVSDAFIISLGKDDQLHD